VIDPALLSQIDPELLKQIMQSQQRPPATTAQRAGAAIGTIGQAVYNRGQPQGGGGGFIPPNTGGQGRGGGAPMMGGGAGPGGGIMTPEKRQQLMAALIQKIFKAKKATSNAPIDIRPDTGDQMASADIPSFGNSPYRPGGIY
jgi:hypothetical protein